MHPVHTTLTPLLDLPALTGIRISFISERTPDRAYLYHWFPSSHARQFLYQFIKSCDMALEVLKAQSPQLYLIFEHKSHYAFPMYVALLIRRKPVLFFVHGLQQTCYRGAWYMFGLKILRLLVSYSSFFPIHLEKSDRHLPSGIRFRSDKALVMPFPHPLANSNLSISPNKWNRSKFRIGVVGMLRQDKPTRKLLEALIGLKKKQNHSFELVFGTPFWQKPDWVDALDIDEILDTGTPSSYIETLKSINIAIHDFRREDYLFRPSGVINDSGMCGCYILCPRFPVFEAQITTPIAIGKTFQSYEEIPDLLSSVIKGLRQGIPDFEQWRSYRGIDRLSISFRGFLERVVRPSMPSGR